MGPSGIVCRGEAGDQDWDPGQRHLGTKGTDRQQLGGQEGPLEIKERRTCKRGPVGRVNSSQNPVG